MTTPLSLLERLSAPAPDPAAWGRFVELYTPLLVHWARGMGLQDADVADLIQDVFQVLVRQLPDFRPTGPGSFRGWLRVVLLNRWRTISRGRAERPGGVWLEPVADDPVEGLIEAEYQRYMVGRAMRVMKSDFQETTWKACWEQVCNGRAAAEVASELGITLKAAYLARARVLRRLRQELEGLWIGPQRPAS
jgi:RNA polymerase sigma-70 factor (ECF subfamily)